MRQPHYLSYHNPDAMGEEFRDIALSGCIGTDKERVAERAAEEDAIVWCVGKRDDGQGARYFLYQRIVDTRCRYTKPEQIAQGEFRILLCGKTTLPAGYEKDITDEPYMAEVKKILGFGLQPMGLKHKATITAFIREFERNSL
ncbi:hypothetical protein [Deinococcus sp. NW-56]|uniref:hypothetical protein n=1 Tax=Deinococcus sp. NW-56 TaxID=2080419 RepID=UPI000CF3E323|nr:hypothetical protein [Deinococcus sp. NW-56]